MQFLKTLFWVVIAVFLAILASRNWHDVTLNLWGDIQADVKIPILLIRGKLSDVVSPEGVKDFLANVPHAEFVELSDAGHTAAGDDNDAFSEAVVQFVSR